MPTNNGVNTSLSGQSGTGAFLGDTAPVMTLPDMSNTIVANVASPVSNLDGANKQYVDTEISALSSTYVTLATAQNITGAKTFQADVDMDSNFITNLADPINAQDAATRAFVLANSTGRLNAVRIYTTSTTWTKPSEFTSDSFVKVTVIGGGGSGGGTGATGAGQSASSGGGGGGGTSIKTILSSSLGASETVTVGAGAPAPTAGLNNGSTGGTSSFGAHLSAGGGAGGTSGSPTSSNNATNLAPGGIGVGGDINVRGDSGGQGHVINGFPLRNSFGGGTFLAGYVSVNQVLTNGGAGGAFGGGGTGIIAGVSTAARTGGIGSDGIVIVEEYI